MIWGLRCTLLWVGTLAVVSNAATSWQVEDAFGEDATFSPAGTLSEGVQASSFLSTPIFTCVCCQYLWAWQGQDPAPCCLN